ncbi:MAG: hypothetical protein H0U24_08180 [Thermoleophilaceae bacterium]|nr:hypothetical protein [Thermoleophilaceae bacterium]
MSYFTSVRLFSLFELCLFSALVAFAIGGWSEDAALVLGWSHGVGWILLCLAVAAGCRRRVFPWPLLAATVSPLGPVGSTLGIELLSRRRRAAAPG